MSSNFAELAPANRPNKRVVFDPTINLGHVISLIAFLLAGFSAYGTLDKRLTMVEQAAVTMAEKDRDQDKNFKEVMVDVKADLKELQRSVNDVNRTLAFSQKK